MVCRSCSAGLGQLPKRFTAPLQHGFLDITPLRASARFAVGSPFATPQSTPARSVRRALHTTPPRQKFNFKDKVLDRVAQTLATGKSSYYIYGATERVYKIFAAQADYTIDVEDRKAGTLKATADGEEIGTSKGGPWHEGMFNAPPLLLSLPIANHD